MEEVVYFAKTNFRNKDQIFGIKTPDRRQHTYIIGKTGTGKSALITNLALQDIKNGKGLCIIDPHGELVENIAARIPEERIKDVIYFNPEDIEYPIGFNVLEVFEEKYKHLVASDLMGIFTKIWANVWSARMEYILNNCVLALLDTPGTTLLGVTRILVDKDYRQKIINNVKDPVIRSFWIHEYETWRDQFRNEAIVPIQNKVGQFLSTPLIRNIVGQSKSTINIKDVMDSGKILLVNISKGKIGEDNSALLGAMIITKIQLAAMERVRIVEEEERRDFYLYVDEFQNFATESFAHILSEARKYRLNLVVAHQYIGQLVTATSTAIRDAIFGNVGTMLVFRVGASDAEFLENEFQPEFEIQDLVNLPNYNVYLKLMVNGVTSRPFSATTLPPLSMASSEKTLERLIENSRKLYTRDRQIVEKEIQEWSGMAAKTSFTDTNTDKNNKFQKFETKCSNCQKSTQVNFQPDGIRPVYCQDCLEKLKKGEIAPVRAKSAIKYEKRQFQTDLSELGIAFPSSQQTSKKPENYISLKELADKKPKPAPNIQGLKDTLKNILGNDKK